MDTSDSILMTGAYGWAFVKPVRKLWYNLTITAASVVVAIFIGGIEALGLISDKLGLEGGVWSFIGDLNDNLANFRFRGRRHLPAELADFDHPLQGQGLRQLADQPLLTHHCFHRFILLRLEFITRGHSYI